ncbi:MAG TPA: ECF transporter S component [Thermoanaerobaculia bacterium]|nr:ECF transporter S component [Thermoanaerobaculia bacterium]
MTKVSELKGLTRTGVIAVLTALAALGTLLIRIPIPATTGYFNIGDMFVILAGLWLGPMGGLIVGAVGPTIADAIGFPQFMLATAVTKGIEGWLVGLVGGGFRSTSLARKIAAAAVGAATIMIGYFVFEAFIYPYLARTIPFFAVTDWAAALVELLPNAIQGVIGAIGGVALWRTVIGRSPEERSP